MWTTFTVSLLVSLSTGYFFFTAHDRRLRTTEGLIAAGSMMICLGIAPFPIQIVLLLVILAVEQWRIRWEKAQKAANSDAKASSLFEHS